MPTRRATAAGLSFFPSYEALRFGRINAGFAPLVDATSVDAAGPRLGIKVTTHDFQWSASERIGWRFIPQARL